MNWEPSIAEQIEEDRQYRRRRVLKSLRIYFAERRSARLVMTGIVAGAGVASLIGSRLLLGLGLDSMWQRYPLAILGGWILLLGLTRLWAEIERTWFSAAEVFSKPLLGRDPADATGPIQDGKWSWFEDLLPKNPGDGGVWPALLGLCVLGVAIGWLPAVWSMIKSAPILIAEVFLDGVLVPESSGATQDFERHSWLGAAFRLTALPACFAAISLAGIGAAFHCFAPEARSVVEVWRHWELSPGLR